MNMQFLVFDHYDKLSMDILLMLVYRCVISLSKSLKVGLLA